MGKGCIYPGTAYTGATEDGPRWKSAAFRGTGQENWLTTFRTGRRIARSRPLPATGNTMFTDIYAGRARRIRSNRAVSPLPVLYFLSRARLKEQRVANSRAEQRERLSRAKA